MSGRAMELSNKGKPWGKVQTTFARGLAQKLMFCCFTVLAALSLISVAFADLPPPGWRQVNQNGFGYGPTSSGTLLFVFDDRLFAFNDQGWFRMEDPMKKVWTQLAPPNPPKGPGTPPFLFSLGDPLKPFRDFLYAYNSGQLWWIGKGADPNGLNWNKVTSTGLPGGVSPIPRVMFNGKIYGVYTTNSYGNFEIWRTGDVGKTAATWEKVVTNSFGDPTNNTGVDIMIVFHNHIYAGTQTLHGNFGTPSDYGTGVEIWESASGNLETWTQVNADGFGTKCAGCNFATNQMIGSAGVYQLPSQSHEYLYIGTLSHQGGEVWRYDGTGLSGWTNVTPPWAGTCYGPSRMEAMALFQGELYLAEGFPQANLAKYDGANWSVVVNGPTPFDPLNGGLMSLAVFKDKLYVGTLHELGSTQGDQVWSYPYFSLAVASQAEGLWLYRDGAWTLLAPLLATRLASFGPTLIVNFPSFGLYQYDGTLWTHLSSNSGVENLVAGSSNLYIDFGTNGLYKYSAGTLTQMTTFNPDKMAANGSNNLLATFLGLGLFQYEEYSPISTNWTWLSTYNGVEDMLGISGKVYADAGTLGLWKYDGVWTCIAPVNPNKIQAYESKLVANFPTYGLFLYDGSNWTSWLTAYDGVQNLIGVSSNLYADFGTYGLWKYSAGTWTPIAIHANRLGSYGNKLVANFTGIGLFEYDGANWTFLTPFSDVVDMVGVTCTE